MKLRFTAILAAAFLLLTGCAGMRQQPVALDPGLLSTKGDRIGVAMTALPKVDTHLPGAGCLLCMAVASTANSSLTKHTQTLPMEDLPKLKEAVAELIRKKGGEVTVIEEAINLENLPNFSSNADNATKKDFHGFQQKYAIDKLLVIDITTLGMLRNYSGYIPTSDPKGVLQGSGYLVNLKTNVYEWY